MVSTPVKVLNQLKNKYCKTTKTLEDLKTWVALAITHKDHEPYHGFDFWYHYAHLKFLTETKTFSMVVTCPRRTTYCEVCLPLRHYLEHHFGIDDFDHLISLTTLADPDWEQIISEITEQLHLHAVADLDEQDYDNLFY